MPDLIERVSDFIIFVNDFPYLRTEMWNSNKGIVRVYGKDGSKEKINYVIYPKKYYDRQYIEENIIPKYENCTLCKIGKDISNINFKYDKKKNNINNNNGNFFMKSIKNMLGKFNDPIKKEYIGQGLGALSKFGISNITTELGNKIITSAIGAVGNVINETKVRNDLLRAMFTHMMYAFADPTANQLREMKRNAGDLANSIKGRNFGTAFGSLLEEPQEVISAWKNLFNFSGFKGFGRRKSYATAGQSSVFQTEPKKRGIVSSYSIPIDSKDLIDI